jgi:hypothetical protein
MMISFAPPSNSLLVTRTGAIGCDVLVDEAVLHPGAGSFMS